MREAAAVYAEDARMIVRAGRESLQRILRPGDPDGEESVLIRAYGDGEAPGSELALNEYEITRGLDADGILVPDELDTRESPPSLVYRCRGLAVLRESLGASPAAPDAVIHVARSLLRTVGRLHTLGILHLAINPYNVLARASGRELPDVLLTGFGRAARAGDSVPCVGLPGYPREYWPYLSPEQTGRTGIIPDTRSDYYSIGATLYALAGGLPLAAAEPEEMVYAILAALPPRLSETAPSVHPVFDAVVARLLAKDPGDRFRSAGEALRELDACGGERTGAPRRSRATAARAPRPAVADGPRRPSGLVGRDRECAWMEEAIARARGGQPVVLSVRGFSGTGKTSLVRDALRRAEGDGVTVLAGKFEQGSAAPYAAFVQACDAYVRRILAQPEAEVSLWKQRVSRRLEGTAPELMGVFPQLEALLGTQGSAPRTEETSSIESKRRFQRSVRDLIVEVAGSGTLAVLFLDDLQWADAASLELCLTLAKASIPGLLLAVAYRSNEVPPGHPLRPLIDEIDARAGEGGRLNLEPLASRGIGELLRSCAPGLPRQDLAALARRVGAYTGGNPLYVLQHVRALRERRELCFDFLAERWLYDARAEEEARSPDMIAFLTACMRELPAAEQRALSAASFFSRGVAADALGRLAEVPAERLSLAVRRLKNRRWMTDDGGEAGTALLRFTHDNIRQAAFELSPRTGRAAFHLRVGRLLLAGHADGDDECLYEIVEHLNAGRAEMTESEERFRAAGLDLEAGKKAKRAGSFTTTARCLFAGVDLLPEDSWRTRYELALALHNEAADAAFLVGDAGRMNALTETVIRGSRAYLDSVPAYEVRIQALMAANRLQESARLCFEVAGRLGTRHLGERKGVMVAARLLLARLLLRTADLSRARLLTDPVLLAAQRVMLKGFAPTVTSMSAALMPLAVENVLITLRGGVSVYAPPSVAQIGMVCVARGRIDEGYRIGELALRLQERLDPAALRADLLITVDFFINAWKRHARDMADIFLDLMAKAIQRGDYEYAALAGHFHAEHVIQGCAMSLEEVCRHLEKVTADIDGLRQARSSLGIRRHHQFALNLVRSPEGAPPHVFAGPVCDERDALPLYEAAGDGSAMVMLFTYKMILCLYFDDLESAAAAGARAASLLPSVPAQPPVHMVPFYHSLVLLSLYASRGRMARRSIRAQVLSNMRKLGSWSRSSPVNFRHRHDLVAAEYLGAMGRRGAERAFMEAARGAEAAGYVQDEALAHQRMARYFSLTGREDAARDHLRIARDLYDRWGASAVVRHLERINPWLDGQGAGAPAAVSAPPPVDLDAETLMNAGRVISSQIEVDSLVDEVIRITMQCAGATRGILELEDGGALVASVEGTSVQGRIEVRRNEGPARMDAPVMNYVRRTREPIVSGGGTDASAFGGQTRSDGGPRSVLCAPLLHRGTLRGIIYLENTLASGIFVPQRLKIVQLLAAQAAAAFENASLYRLKGTLAAQREQLLHANRLASIGVLIAEVAHEVNSPNHVIRLDADFLKEESRRLFTALAEAEADLQDGATAEAGGASEARERCAQFKRAIQRIQDSSARIEAIVGELKGFLRGGERSPFGPVDLNEVVESTLKLSEPLLRASTARLDVKLAPGLPRVTGDRVKLQQVVLNLVENACQALTDHGQSITVRTVHRRGAGRVALVLKDEGRGIAREDLPRVTEPFFSTRREEGGTGLGLSITAAIVREHGGEIEISSRLGAGTRVEVTLPATFVP